VSVLGKLDRYVASHFLSSYGVCLLFFLGMFVLIDLLGKSDDIFENARKVSELGHSVAGLLPRFYGLMLPFIFLQVAPFVTVMAAIFCITRLRRSNEMIPMIVAGRSLYRVMLPIFVFAVLLAIGMGLVQQYIAPGLADKRSQLKELIFEGEASRIISDDFRISDAIWIRVNDYDIDKRRIASFDITDISSLEPSATGRDARWNEERGLFVYKVEVPDAAGKLSKVERTLPPELEPELIESKEWGPYDVSYSQAQFLYERTGDPRWKVLLHYHLTFPLSNLLLLLLGLPFVVRPGARSLLLGMVIAILICGAYFAFDAVMRNVGEKNVLHPVLAAWFGVIFFGSLGVVLIDSVKT
jgi:lipopolysaccharide export system permease protein